MDWHSAERAYVDLIMGMAPNRRIHIRRDILEEVDGPMLRHGLQEAICAVLGGAKGRMNGAPAR